MPRMRTLLAAANLRHVADRQARSSGEDAERDVLDLRKNLAVERREIDELAVVREGDEAIFGQLLITALDVAKAIEAEFIPQDIRTFLEELERLA
jgi:hypothetical protein